MNRGSLTDPDTYHISTVSYRFDSIDDHLTLMDDADGESVVLAFGEQVKLLTVLVKEHPDLAEAILKEVRRDAP
jgi:hypothetical protein